MKDAEDERGRHYPKKPQNCYGGDYLCMGLRQKWLASQPKT